MIQWNEDEVAYLKANLRTMTYKEIAENLTRATGKAFGWETVKEKAKKLHIRGGRSKGKRFPRKKREFSWDTVRKIRQLWCTTDISRRKLMRKFSNQGVGSILINKTYYDPDYVRPRKEKKKGSKYRVKAFGETKDVSQWADDPRCEVARGTIIKRIKRGITGEACLRRSATAP